jgi:lysophospholipase L1-like esterase
MKLFYFLLALVLTVNCSDKNSHLFEADHTFIRYSGRYDNSNPKEKILIGSAAFVEMSFSGDSCIVFLKNSSPNGLHNFVSFELDHQYLGRVRIEGNEMKEYVVPISEKKSSHFLRIYKETEAQNGYVVFGGIKCQALNQLPELPNRNIEFVGNSITCGMGADTEAIPCGTDQWYDQHNAYLAYGPRIARALNAQYMLSSVSGIGIYRNWNSNAPVMPDVYENTYLNTNNDIKWDFAQFTPDLVSICLGTNDFSDGDGINERLPFDSTNFVDRYIEFVTKVSSIYPDAQICLLSSPMLSGEKDKLLLSCLYAVQQNFATTNPDKKTIAVFSFKTVEPKGCTYHPDIEDHRMMAEEMLPFYRELSGWTH